MIAIFKIEFGYLVALLDVPVFQNSEVRCERVECLPPDCGHPATPPGECCPVCNGEIIFINKI